MADQPDEKKPVENISQRVNRDYTRRDFLKTAGTAATLGAASAFGASGLIKQISNNKNNLARPRSTRPTGMASGADYETIQASGQTIRIDSGETWENKLIDLGDGNEIGIIATGTNWTIRNVGVKGTWHHETHDYIFNVSDEGGGDSIVENVYVGEGDPNASASERGGCFWVPPEHSGTLTLRNVNFNIEGALGIYGHSPGASGGAGGTVHIEDSYARDSHHTAYRIADNGSSIKNSVVYKTGNRTAARGCWIWEGYGGGANLENVHITTNGMGGGIVTRGDPELNMTKVYTDDGSGTHPKPEHFVPEGTPESAEAAASGTGGSGGRTGNEGSKGLDLPEEKAIVLSGGSQSNPANYVIEVDGDISGDGTIFSNSATGTLKGGKHQYDINGEITNFKAEEGVDVQVNQQQMSGRKLSQLCSN